MTTSEPAPRRVGPQVRWWWDRWDGWLVAIAVTALAAALRLPSLGRPHELVFDETYYVKDAWTLLHLGYEAQWGDDPDPAFEAGDVDGYSTRASYVVHPPAGKWLIALGLKLLGATDPVGWRLGTAAAGIVAVLLLTRIARRLFTPAPSDLDALGRQLDHPGGPGLDPTLLGGVAGTLLAIDGTAISLSRTALLDGPLMLWVLAAFGALLVDRDRTREHLGALTAPPRAAQRWGPGLGLRPWRVLAGVLLGLAIGTKWSGLWFLAVLGLLTVGWDASARRRAGVRRWWQAAVLRDAGPAFVSLVPVATLTYLATWTGWFTSAESYGRQWATRHPGEGVTWLPDALRSLWKYHRDMWHFHTTLTTEHAWAAHPLGWILQWKPTLFFYAAPEPAQQYCGADRCSQSITSQGNPLLWWLAAAAVLACVWWVVRRHDGVAAAALSGVVAGWLPWFLYAYRTIFAFYSIVFLPWTILCLTWASARLLRWGELDEVRRPVVRTVLVVLAVLVVGASWFYYPLWTGQVVTFRFWQLHQGVLSGT